MDEDQSQRRSVPLCGLVKMAQQLEILLLSLSYPEAESEMMI